ncbi:hypothetical protein ILUMI_14736 [Ignelater luminosus]|uniref:Uncharacterized protein n=1 Tax=Ignelater luminosus TaxID=2038154 RepID=A0A8K0CU89_IGNLU|nr:hypothetical protein ILUMI_14736 [Ignelater luminosus]
MGEVVAKTLKTKFEELLDKVNQLETCVKSSQNDKDELLMKINDLEQYRMPNIGMEIKGDSIDRCHRVRAYKPNSKHPRGVIMEFINYKYNSFVFNSKKYLT